jgi:hypothetical protein
MLADDVVERTKYNIVNNPASLGLIGPPESIHDFKVIAHIRKKLYKRCQKMRLLLGPHQEPDNMSTYLIHVETGDIKNAGTNATISITLTGKYLGKKSTSQKQALNVLH